jgi:endonuclease YncB( thermonuclease family)
VVKRRTKRRLISAALILAVLAFVVLIRLVEVIGPEGRPGDRFTVWKIIDGDTMELKGGDRLRLLAIDTPEKDEPFYDEATALLARLAYTRLGRIEYSNRRRDKYGRLLGYLYVDDTLFVNRVLIDSGLANVYLFDDNDLANPCVRQLIEAQRSAIERRVGLWSLPREPEPYYVNKPGSFRLHRPGCRTVRDLRPGQYRKIPTREEGLAEGLSPCRICKP